MGTLKDEKRIGLLDKHRLIRMRMTPDGLKVTTEFNKPFPFRDEDVDKALLDQGFRRPKDEERNVIRITSEGTQSMATRWMMEGTDAFYEAATGRLAVDGRQFEEVSKAFTKMLAAIKHLSAVSKDVQIRWAEMVVKLRAYGAPPPLEAFRRLGDSKVEAAISKAFGEEMHAFSVTLYSAQKGELDKPLNKIEDWVHLTIAPLVPNPSVYVLQFVYRKRNLEDVQKRVDTLVDNLEKTFDAIGVTET